MAPRDGWAQEEAERDDAMIALSLWVFYACFLPVAVFVVVASWAGLR
jgi:hypothetical protein